MKSQQRFKSERHNVFTEEIREIALKLVKTIYGRKKNASKLELQKNKKLFSFDYVTKEDIKEHNPKWPEIPQHPSRVLIIAGSESRKANALLNLINNDPDIDQFYYCAKDPYEAKYQLLLNKRKKGLKHLNDLKAFIEHSNDMDDIHENIEEYNPNKKTQKH